MVHTVFDMFFLPQPTIMGPDENFVRKIVLDARSFAADANQSINIRLSLEVLNVEAIKHLLITKRGRSKYP